jgi:hypothetical protein
MPIYDSQEDLRPTRATPPREEHGFHESFAGIALSTRLMLKTGG